MDEVKESPETRNDTVDSDDDEFIEEPYIPDERLNLPSCITLPKTMREGSRIEQTAAFVALKGSQMEIVIRVRQKDKASKFNFLDFEHPLNAFYKVIINEIKNNSYKPKNYIPKRRPKTLCDYSSSDNEDGSNSYLHPSLIKKAKKDEDKAPIGPMCEKEANVIIHKEVNDKAKDLMKQRYDITQGKDMYSKLFKNLVDHSNGDSIDESQKTDYNNETKDYYEWYASIYKVRHSLEPTTLPPIFDPPKALQNIINSAINYITTNGIDAERKLLKANPALTFLLEGDPNYFYYQLKLKQKYIDMGKWHGNKSVEKVSPTLPVMKPPPAKEDSLIKNPNVKSVQSNFSFIDESYEKPLELDEKTKAERQRKAKLFLKRLEEAKKSV
uniref:SURP motif domain-containing protein n=1 Tax=Strongyloides papillosus TaxID=174720 RepID=A0A0N5BHW7_STREA